MTTRTSSRLFSLFHAHDLKGSSEEQVEKGRLAPRLRTKDAQNVVVKASAQEIALPFFHARLHLGTAWRRKHRLKYANTDEGVHKLHFSGAAVCFTKNTVMESSYLKE